MVEAPPLAEVPDNAVAAGVELEVPKGKTLRIHVDDPDGVAPTPVRPSARPRCTRSSGRSDPVKASEIGGLEALRGYLKSGNYIVPLTIDYWELGRKAEGFMARELPAMFPVRLEWAERDTRALAGAHGAPGPLLRVFHLSGHGTGLDLPARTADGAMVQRGGSEADYPILHEHRARYRYSYFYLRDQVLGPMILRMGTFISFEGSLSSTPKM